MNIRKKERKERKKERKKESGMINIEEREKDTEKRR